MNDAINMPDLFLYKFQFNMEFLEDALLPKYKGSTLHGAFGTALKEVAGNFSNIYKDIFETEEVNKPKNFERVKKIPHPYILMPPLSDKRTFKKGEIFPVSISLFGNAHNFLKVIIDSFTLLCKTGLTKKKYKLRLLNVYNEDYSGTLFLAYDSINKTIYNNYRPITRSEIILNNNRQSAKIKLNFLTPFQIQKNSVEITESNINEISPALLVASLENRYKTIAHFYCGSNMHDSEIFKPHNSVLISNMNLCHYLMPNYSSRIRQKRVFIGLIGSITLEGNLTSIMPLLQIGRWLNIGKKTSYGWGQYTIDYLD